MLWAKIEIFRKFKENGDILSLDYLFYKQHRILEYTNFTKSPAFITKSRGDIRNYGEVPGLALTNRNTKNEIRTKKTGSIDHNYLSRQPGLHSSKVRPLKSLKTAEFWLLFPGVSLVSLSLRASTSTKLEHIPVKDVVVGEALTVEQVSEQLAKVTEKLTNR